MWWNMLIHCWSTRVHVQPELLFCTTSALLHQSQQTHKHSLQSHSVTYHWLDYMTANDNMLKYNWNVPTACNKSIIVVGERYCLRGPIRLQPGKQDTRTHHETLAHHTGFCSFYHHSRRGMFQRRSIQSEAKSSGIRRTHSKPQQRIT